jgi:hypothetical protein
MIQAFVDSANNAYQLYVGGEAPVPKRTTTRERGVSVRPSEGLVCYKVGTPLTESLSVAECKRGTALQ